MPCFIRACIMAWCNALRIPALFLLQEKIALLSLLHWCTFTSSSPITYAPFWAFIANKRDQHLLVSLIFWARYYNEWLVFLLINCVLLAVDTNDGWFHNNWLMIVISYAFRYTDVTPVIIYEYAGRGWACRPHALCTLTGEIVHGHRCRCAWIFGCL